MKETGFVSSTPRDDSMIRFKYQTLMIDYHELRKETELKRRKLEMMKQKRSTLIAEVRFLRRRYKHLKQDQTIESSSEMFRLSEHVDLEGPSGKSKKHFGLKESVPCFDLKQKNIISNEKEALAKNKLKRSRENEVSTNSILLHDLKSDENNFINRNSSGFDLNQISREEEEPEGNGAEGMKKNTMLDNGINGEIKLPICGDEEKELNRAVKRKVSWQDPVALRV